MNTQPTRARAVTLAALALSAGLAAACSARDRTVEIGQNIHHDDFEYAVIHLDKADKIGDLAAKGAFYIVTFRVDNRAKRVNHEWDNTLAFIVDEHGVQHDNDTGAQRRLDALDPFGYVNRHLTPPGTIETTKFVFDVPRDVTEPYLQVRGGTLMGDVLDGNQFMHTKVKLF